MKTSTKIKLSLFMAVMILFGCSEYDNGFTEKAIKFRTDFEHEIGYFDAEQDWNLAERANVNVITSTTKELMIYSEKDDSYKLVGHYTGVYGQQKLGVDVEEGTKYLIVSDGEHALRTYTNGTVSFDEMRTWREDEMETRTVISNPPDSILKLKPNPITSGEVDSMKNIEFNHGGTAHNTLLVPWNSFFVQVVSLKASDGNNNFFIYDNNGASNSLTVNGKSYKATEIVSFTGGETIEKNLILVTDIDPIGVPMKGKDVVQFAYKTKNNLRYEIKAIGDAFYIGFDQGSGKYNDLIFKLTKAKDVLVDQGELIDAEESCWTLAAEDLGGTFDVDYNDVVVKVKHISGETKAYVTPLAAGGTLASYLFFNQTPIGEAHQLLGASSKESGEYEPMNVKTEKIAERTPIEMTVDPNWTITLDQQYVYMGNNMGGFNVKVLPAGAPAYGKTLAYNDPAFTNATEVNAPTKGAAPFILCVPYSYTKGGQKHVWAWPMELVHITSAYPEFQNDVQKQTNMIWYQSPVAGQVVDTSGLSAE